jgi:Family of unknown function (DUF6256)
MATNLIVQDVAPIGTGYLILMGVLAAGLRQLRRDQLRSGGQADGQHAHAEDLPAGVPSDAGGAPGSAGKKPGIFARRVPAGWPRFAVQVCSVALGGYLLLMAVDLIYYYGVAKIRGQFIESGFTGGLTLMAIALPLWGLASWLSLRRRSR